MGNLHSRDIWPGEAPCRDTGGRDVTCPLRLGMWPLRNSHKCSPRIDIPAAHQGSDHNSTVLIRFRPTLNPNPAQQSTADQHGFKSQLHHSPQQHHSGQLTRLLPVGQQLCPHSLSMAAITNSHRLCSLNLFLHLSEGQKSKIKVLTGLCSLQRL